MSEERSGKFVVDWRVLAIASAVLFLVSATTLAIVASVRNAEILSVVALALAIISFVIQIILYIAQSNQAAAQQLASTEVYGRTLTALAAIEEKAEGTRSTVNTLSERVLSAAIGKALPGAESEGVPVDSPEFARVVSQLVQEVTTSASAKAASPKPRSERGRAADPSMDAVPEGRRLAAALDALVNAGGPELRALDLLARDQARNGGGDNSIVGPGLRRLNPFAIQELHAKGLVKQRRVPWSVEPVIQLTDVGKDAGRVLIADISEDAGGDDRLQAVRNKLNDYLASLRQKTYSPPLPDIPIED